MVDVLIRKGASDNLNATRGLILVPTKELAEQATQHLKQLTVYLDQEVTIANAASGTTAHLQRYSSLQMVYCEIDPELVQINHVGETRCRRRDTLSNTVSTTVQSGNHRCFNDFLC